MTTPKEDETRLYQCARKYEKIVKQLIEMMNTRTTPPKRRRLSSSCRSSSNGVTTKPASSSSTQPDDNEVFVQTLTKFLNEVRANPPADTDSSTTTRERHPE